VSLLQCISGTVVALWCCGLAPQLVFAIKLLASAECTSGSQVLLQACTVVDQIDSHT
jgi:hypothetical protein